MDLSAGDVAWLAVAAWLVGLAKLSLGGLGAISAAIFAATLPAKESTGTLLPLLVLGDVFAIAAYRRHADRALLLRLMPSVLMGIGLGAVFTAFADDVVMRRAIGALLLVMVVVHLVRSRLVRAAGAGEEVAVRPWVNAGYGSAAGFATMVANAAGPVMALYLVSAGLTTSVFLGTTAVFFLFVNLAKLPFSIGLGVLTWKALPLCLGLAPFVALGAFMGRRLATRLEGPLFTRLVLAATVVSAVLLLR